MFEKAKGLKICKTILKKKIWSLGMFKNTGKNVFSQPLPCKKLPLPCKKFVIFFSTNNFIFILFYCECFFHTTNWKFMRIHIFQFF